MYVYIYIIYRRNRDDARLVRPMSHRYRHRRPRIAYFTRGARVRIIYAPVRTMRRSTPLLPRGLRIDPIAAAAAAASKLAPSAYPRHDVPCRSSNGQRDIFIFFFSLALSLYYSFVSHTARRLPDPPKL